MFEDFARFKVAVKSNRLRKWFERRLLLGNCDLSNEQLDELSGNIGLINEVGWFSNDYVFFRFIKKYRLPFVYNGTGRVIQFNCFGLVGGKLSVMYPNFVSIDKKIAIEICSGRQNYDLEYQCVRSSTYSAYNYETIFLHRRDFFGANWEQLLLEKLKLHLT